MPLARKDLNLWPVKQETAVSVSRSPFRIFIFSTHTCCFWAFSIAPLELQLSGGGKKERKSDN